MQTALAVLFLVLGAWQAKPNIPPSSASEKGAVQKGNSQHQADNPQKKEAEKPQETVGTSGLEEARPKTEAREDYAKKQSCDPLYCAYLWATIIGVCGGFVGLYFIWRQVKATEISANAASKNALALMDAERAWITVSVRGCDDAQERFRTVAYVVIRNAGKTPAKIKKFAVDSRIVRSIQDMGESTEAIDTNIGVANTLISPGDPLEVMIEIPETTDRVAVWGVVKYCDVNNRAWYTRFLYFSVFVSRTLPLVFRRIANGYYNDYGKDYINCDGNPSSNPLQNRN